ncbi:hypothetical protein LS48_08825 [Aequorivita aquimaris]|uniref:Uncharacterized protein n=1 Tax=Aequorivita aquimaris TaxID=1548749 RepID=A0A137RI35_9FLAO|nr:hypothetical protein LS48_08825 [Aequorivita aquimaris]
MLNFGVKIQVILHLVLNNAESFQFVIIRLFLGCPKFWYYHKKFAKIPKNFPTGTLVSNNLDLFGSIPTSFKLLGKTTFLGGTLLCNFSLKFSGLWIE